MSSALNDPKRLRAAHIAIHQIAERLDIPEQSVVDCLHLWDELRPSMSEFRGRALPCHPELSRLIEQGLDYMSLGATMAMLAASKIGLTGFEFVLPGRIFLKLQMLPEPPTEEKPCPLPA